MSYKSVQVPQVAWFLAAISALLLAAANARGESSQSAPKVGDEYQITSRYDTSQRASDGSSGSSSGTNTVVELVVGVHEGELELEYDLPNGATADDRSRNWQFPIRVLKPSNGPMQLLNTAELEVRLGGWLKSAGLTRADCGRWIFTWEALRIECDPQATIATIEALDLRSIDLHEGGFYNDAGARGPGRLDRTRAGPDGETFAAAMEVDPEGVRRARAQSDVVVGEVLRKPVTFEAALRERAGERVWGAISITFETDSRGTVRRRTKVTKLEINGPDGRHESQTTTETVDRRRISSASGRLAR